MTRDASTATDPPKLYLIDGTAQLFRAFYAIRGLTAPDGRPTNATYGFTSMLRKLLTEHRPDAVGVAFDLPGEVFRHESFPDYKANRDETPEDLNRQLPDTKEVCRVLGLTVLEAERYEADDLIATYARLGRDAGYEVVVVASDKDLLQLVRDGVRVFNPTKEIFLDADGVRESFGVPPERVLDAQGLSGDTVDNIPGVPGVGAKSATKIVGEHGDLEAVLARAERFAAWDAAREALVGDPSSERVVAVREVLTALRDGDPEGEYRDRIAAVIESLDEDDAKGALRALKRLDKGSARKMWLAVAANAEQARLSRELARLIDDAPTPESLEALTPRPIDSTAAHALFTELGFRGLTKEFEGSADPAPEAGPSAPAEGDYRTILERGELERAVAACRRAGCFAIDTETTGKDPQQARLVGISLSWEAGSGWYLPIAHNYLGVPEQLRLGEIVELLGPLLADPRVAKVGQNFKYDLHVLRRHGMPVEGWRLDTMVAAFLLDSSRVGYGMDALASEYLGLETLKYTDVVGKGAKQKTLDAIDVDRVTAYAGEDADVTLRLAELFEPRLAEAGLEKVYREIDGPLLPLLARMEAYGIRVDADVLGKMATEMARQMEAARAEVLELAGMDFNIDSPKQLREVLFDRLGLSPGRKTSKSKVASTDAATLEGLVDEHPIAGKLLEYREIAKLKSTYVDALPRLIHPETGRVHTSYHPTGAATGRLSSSDPNLQNIPARTATGRKIRGAFVPDPGYLFLASDYSQVELRVLAHMAEDATLIEAFARGEDIHRYTAASVFGVEPDEVSYEMRTRAKAVNFGILYGMSQHRLAQEQGMTRKEAGAFIAAYFERFSNVEQYIERVRDEAREEGAVRTLFGRVRHFPQLRRKVHRGIQEQALRAALNTTIQGTAADLMKLAMLRVAEALAAEGSAARMLLQVHDELLLEVPEAEIDRVASIVREAMEGVHPLAVPLAVDQERGASWEAVT